MKHLCFVLLCIVTVFVFTTTDATADLSLNWVNSPNSNTGDPTTTVNWIGNKLTIGTLTAEVIDQQPMEIYGVGAALPMQNNNTGFGISLSWIFNTWDSYTAPVDNHTGYWDSWSATITKGDYYWNKVLTDPITTSLNIEEILLLEAGTSYYDGNLETYTGSGTFFYLPSVISEQYYINLVLDTATLPDSTMGMPSWGEFNNVTVTPVPSAIILGVLGLCLSGLKLRKYT